MRSRTSTFSHYAEQSQMTRKTFDHPVTGSNTRPVHTVGSRMAKFDIRGTSALLPLGLNSDVARCLQMPEADTTHLPMNLKKDRLAAVSPKSISLRTRFRLLWIFERRLPPADHVNHDAGFGEHGAVAAVDFSRGGPGKWIELGNYWTPGRMTLRVKARRRRTFAVRPLIPQLRTL